MIYEPVHLSDNGHADFFVPARNVKLPQQLKEMLDKKYYLVGHIVKEGPFNTFEEAARLRREMAAHHMRVKVL